MTTEVRVPEVGESIREVQIAEWFKQEGQWVQKNENLVELDTDKATVQLPAPVAGTVKQIIKREGQPANVGEVIAQIDESAAPPEAAESAQPERAAAVPAENGRRARADASEPSPPAAEQPSAAPAKGHDGQHRPPIVMPAAEHALAEYGLSAEQVEPSRPGGRLLKEDVLRYVERQGLKPAADKPAAPAEEDAPAESLAAARREEVLPMTMIRRRIAQRLVEAQQQAALLTTFNEADLSAVLALRKKFGEPFQERYQVKLGLMSFFVKAAVEALKRFPAVNAEVRGENVVYRNYYDIGIAIGGGKGLVVPVLRSAERMSFAEIEQAIGDLSGRARQNKIKPEELEGGTFTISNGGIYGSLLSTPIVNPPQSGILGLHAIQDRPVARDGQVVIRPMMYLALTYDHRIIDGREAVAFLRAIKDAVEDPARLILEI